MTGARTATATLSAEIEKAFRKVGVEARTSHGHPGRCWRDLFSARVDLTLVWNGADPHLRNLVADAGVMQLHFLVSMHGKGISPEKAARAIRAHFSSATPEPIVKAIQVPPLEAAGRKEVETKKIGIDFGITVTRTPDVEVPGSGRWRLSVLERTPEQLQGIWSALRRPMRPSLVIAASEVCP